MDVLLEMTPGTGWVAREKQRLVFLPGAETVDVAHDVIEPLLLPRDLDESIDIFRGWLQSSRPLPPMLLVALESNVRLLCHNFGKLDITEAVSGESHSLELGTTSEVVQVGKISSLGAGELAEEPSGMLVEGVIRAGGVQLHIHRGWGTEGPPDTSAHERVSTMSIELEGESIAIGTGLVLGRWPYSHPDFDAKLEPVIVADPAVSRLHVEIRPTSEGTVLIDRGSHNGTWVVHSSEGRTSKAEGGVEIPLAAGDQIRLGDTTIRVD